MDSIPPLRVAALHRYPVKGLSPEPLTEAHLKAGGYFPGDRLYAIENGPSGFDPAAPRHRPKIVYVMLMRDAALARLLTRYDDDTGVLSIAGKDEEQRFDLRNEAGRVRLSAYLKVFVPGLRGEPRVLAAPEDYRFTDARTGYVSLLNLASVRALEDMTGARIDPLRFRANLHIEGLPAWAELDLVGRTLALPDGTRLHVTARTERCAATNVDPGTGLRDLAIPRTLARSLGHTDCGVYAEVLVGGTIREGDAVSVAG